MTEIKEIFTTKKYIYLIYISQRNKETKKELQMTKAGQLEQ